MLSKPRTRCLKEISHSFCFLQVITALGKIWHPEHFQCAHCTVELGTQNFFERDGLPYCEKDYHQLFSPMCAACSGPILDVSTGREQAQPTHTQMLARESVTYPRCYLPAKTADELFLATWKASQQLNYFYAQQKCITALDTTWHPEHFTCASCGAAFGEDGFHEKDGKAFCRSVSTFLLF